jgi:hypothetical protein
MLNTITVNGETYKISKKQRYEGLNFIQVNKQQASWEACMWDMCFKLHAELLTEDNKLLSVIYTRAFASKSKQVKLYEVAYTNNVVVS